MVSFDKHVYVCIFLNIVLDSDALNGYRFLKTDVHVRTDVPTYVLYEPEVYGMGIL